MLELLCQGLRDSGHTAMPASDGDAGLELAINFDFDAMVLDIGLPGRDGYSVAIALRKQKKSAPIIMLTARDAEDDIIRGFDLGVDDYLTKPFSFRELLVRLEGLTRSSRPTSATPALLLDPIRLTAQRDGEVIRLTRSEYLLLASLNDHDGAPTTRQELTEAIWGQDQTVTPNTLDVLVNALRSKLDAPYKHKLLHTVRGVGYRLQTTFFEARSEEMQLQKGLPS